MAASQSAPGSVAKGALRDQLLTARNQRSLAESADFSQQMTEHLFETPDVRRAATVACYVSVGREPGTHLLLDALRAAGKRVILPLLQPDRDLDWAVYTDADHLFRAPLGLLEPDSAGLGREAIATADVVLVPGLAVSSRGDRLGRGGGSYDRALGRVPVGTFTCVLLFPDEVGVRVPVEPHDRPVTAAASAAGVVRFT